MGCDIHLHIELQDSEGSWHHYSPPDIKRHYGLFARMAGVRIPDIEPIALPRGLPEDLTPITAADHQSWIGDAHHSSWLSSDEIVQLGSEFHLCDVSEDGLGFGYLFGNDWAKASLEGPFADFRFVFWFDN